MGVELESLINVPTKIVQENLKNKEEKLSATDAKRRLKEPNITFVISVIKAIIKSVPHGSSMEMLKKPTLKQKKKKRVAKLSGEKPHQSLTQHLWPPTHKVAASAYPPLPPTNRSNKFECQPEAE